MTRQPISRHGWDHMPGGQDSIWNDPWIYIGTLGVDNADDQLNGNQPPFNPSLEGTQAQGYPTGVLIPYLNIPFQNGWTNYGNGYSPVCFIVTIENHLEIHGAITGGADGSVVFTLPDLSTLNGGVDVGPPPTQAAPWYWAPTPNGSYGDLVMGTYWPLYTKPLIAPLADGSGTAFFQVGVDGNVTYLTAH